MGSDYFGGSRYLTSMIVGGTVMVNNASLSFPVPFDPA